MNPMNDRDSKRKINNTLGKHRLYTVSILCLLIFQAALITGAQCGRADTSNMVIIVVNDTLFNEIQENLNQYSNDLEMLGYSPLIVTQHWNSPEELRSYLLDQYSQGLIGIIIVGDIPSAWYEMEEDYFPMDIFYMDLDGIWSDNDNDGYYDEHSGHTEPEIWVGRITAATLTGDEGDLTNSYLEKLHDLRMGNYTPNEEALLYVDDDWVIHADTWENDLGYLYDNITKVDRRVVTCAQDYMDRLDQDFEWIHVAVHSYPTYHWFKVGTYQMEYVTGDDIKAIGPEAYYYNLFACSAARYTEGDYIGGWYLFSESKGVVAIGSTKSGAMKEFDDFYRPLGEGKSIGTAFFEWYQEHGENEPDWYYGLTILGDPTLIPTDPYIHENEVPFIQILEPDGVDDIADESYVIEWDDADPDNDAQISLFYDMDDAGFDGILINQEAISEDSSVDEYVWDTREISEGNYYIYACIDDMTNAPVYVYSGGYVTIDHPNILPQVEITYPTGGTVYDEVTIQGTAEDPDNNNIESVYISIDDPETWDLATGTTSWSYVWDTTIYSDGEHTIYAKAYDGEDSSDIADITVTVENGGNEMPLIVITSPTENDIVSGTIEIIGTASDDSSIALVQVAIDDVAAPWHDAIDTSGDNSWSTWMFTWDTIQFDNGERTIYARAKDDFGEYSITKSIMVIVDNGGNIPPNVRISSHSGGEIVSGMVDIKGTAEDPDGDISLVEVRIDDDNDDWFTATGTTSWTYSLDTTAYDNGEHVVFVRAKDAVNAYSQTESVGIIISNEGGNVPPIVNIISPIDGAVSGIVMIRGTALDVNEEDTVVVQIRIDNGDWIDAEGTTDWSYCWNTTGLDDGNYTIHVRAFDGIDYSKEKSVAVAVDNPHEPTLAITSEIPDTVSGTITIQGTAYDVDGEVIKIEIQIDGGEWEEIDGTTDWSYELDTTELSDGKHTIYIRVTDDEGKNHIVTYLIDVNNSQDIQWWPFFVVLMAIIITLVVAVTIKRRRSGAEEEPMGAIRAEKDAQYDFVSLRCSRCDGVFETSLSSPIIQCPNCGLSGKLE